MQLFIFFVIFLKKLNFIIIVWKFSAKELDEQEKQAAQLAYTNRDLSGLQVLIF